MTSDHRRKFFERLPFKAAAFLVEPVERECQLDLFVGGTRAEHTNHFVRVSDPAGGINPRRDTESYLF
jgi:hypothetical protein